jgi:hypothetical protein
MNRLSGMVAMLCLATPVFAAAQALQPLPPGVSATTSSTPRLEIGVQTSYASLLNEDAKTVGIRFGHRYQDWLVTEWNVERTENRYQPDSYLLVGNLRLQSPAALAGKRPFLIGGIAAANGLSFRWSPVVGVGSQMEMPDGVLAFRVEFQYFTRARRDSGLDDRLRLLVGASIGLP